MNEKILRAMDEAERKAIDNLARYKFSNFGYWAAWWVKLNQLSGLKRPNPFRGLVNAARQQRWVNEVKPTTAEQLRSEGSYSE